MKEHDQSWWPFSHIDQMVESVFRSEGIVASRASGHSDCVSHSGHGRPSCRSGPTSKTRPPITSVENRGMTGASAALPYRRDTQAIIPHV
jgi:hypothetical protein